MKITEVSVRVRSALEAGEFYADALGLAVVRTPGAATVTVGTTRLELVEDPAADGDHHFAITIPSNKFDEAKEWIERRAVLLGTPDADEFECSPAWNARSVYFAGPDRSVLELIIRRDLRNATDGPFTSADLLCLSEIGVAVPGVPALAAALGEAAGVAPYGGAPGDTFAPVGDADGLLILVETDRTWFPTTDRVARETPVSVTASGGRAGTYPLGPRGSLRILP